jgi:hypothetical protein
MRRPSGIGALDSALPGITGVVERPQAVGLAVESVPSRLAEHHIRCDRLSSSGNAGHERLVAFLGDHEMQVRGPVRITILRAQETLARAVHWNG